MSPDDLKLAERDRSKPKNFGWQTNALSFKKAGAKLSNFQKPGGGGNLYL